MSNQENDNPYLQTGFFGNLENNPIYDNKKFERFQQMNDEEKFNYIINTEPSLRRSIEHMPDEYKERALLTEGFFTDEKEMESLILTVSDSQKRVNLILSFLSIERILEDMERLSESDIAQICNKASLDDRYKIISSSKMPKQLRLSLLSQNDIQLAIKLCKSNIIDIDDFIKIYNDKSDDIDEQTTAAIPQEIRQEVFSIATEMIHVENLDLKLNNNESMEKIIQDIYEDEVKKIEEYRLSHRETLDIEKKTKEYYVYKLQELFKLRYENKGYRSAYDALRIIEELQNPKQPEKGKYKIPHEFLYEALENMTAEQARGLEDMEPCMLYLRLNTALSKEQGEMLEKMYKDKDSYLFVHTVIHGAHYSKGLKTDIDYCTRIINEICKNGLKASNQGNAGIPRANYTMMGNAPIQHWTNSFLTMLRPYFDEDGLCKPFVCMQIPKNIVDNNEPIWGSKEQHPQGNNFYILPEYVKGYCDFIGSQEAFIENSVPLSERTNYRYHFRDGSLEAIDVQADKKQEDLTEQTTQNVSTEHVESQETKENRFFEECIFQAASDYQLQPEDLRGAKNFIRRTFEKIKSTIFGTKQDNRNDEESLR